MEEGFFINSVNFNLETVLRNLLEILLQTYLKYFKPQGIKIGSSNSDLLLNLNYNAHQLINNL
jgi:hypothetical protein